MSTNVQALRVADYNEVLQNLDKVCYYNEPEHGWFVYFPNGLLATLANHKVTEHEDGTISVTPLILVANYDLTIHGYLTKGIWLAC